MLDWIKSFRQTHAAQETVKMAFADEGIRQKVQPEHLDSNETIRFTLTPAVGGRILRVVRDGGGNSLKIGNDSSQLYVIPSGEDVGARVAKIINMELMK